jgi:NAD(P)-dependent dehydrogenase (short-subunit alcohol dehydrogenase family)
MMTGGSATRPSAGERLAGKVGLVTGAAVGIGKAIAKRFAAEGMVVGVNDLHGPGAREVVREILAAGGQAIELVMDIGQRDRMHQAVDTLAQQCGRFDVMVNNAAWVHYEAIPDITEDSFARMLSAGFASVTWGTQAAAQAMGERGGAIINVASGASFLGLNNAMIYCGIKAGVLGLTRAAAVELGPRKIRVNAVAPGPTWSPTTAAVLSPEKAQNRAERTPLRRIGEPEDVAAAAFFLADSESAFVTGAVISVDGGLTFAYQ